MSWWLVEQDSPEERVENEEDALCECSSCQRDLGMCLIQDHLFHYDGYDGAEDHSA